MIAWCPVKTIKLLFRSALRIQYLQMSLTCRFYKNRLPDIDEHVMLLVTNVAEVGVDVNLLEYDGRQGLSSSSTGDFL